MPEHSASPTGAGAAGTAAPGATADQPSHRLEGVLALDGPSGTGKSTVARRVAQRLAARYLDTGAMYRAATVAVLRAGVDPADEAAVARVVRAARIEIATDPTRPAVCLDGRAVDAEIRSGEVTAAVSQVSATPAVRELLVAAQRELIAGGCGVGEAGPGIVVEGRDIASVVWPQAPCKVYLTASAQARAARRAAELGVDPAAVAADIERRDRLDSTRASGPLTRADGAVVLDTTHLDIDAVVNRLIDMATNRD